MAINFFPDDVAFELPDPDRTIAWILRIMLENGYQVEELNYVFCSDEKLLAMNQQYLDHNYFTDILTFPYHEADAKQIYADIHISIDRVKENAATYNSSFLDELDRVMIHGVLHLMGYRDDAEEAKANMRRLETEALAKR